MFCRVLPLLIACLLPAVASAQISMEDEYRPHRMIIAEYQWTPQGDQEIDLLWDVPDGVDYEQVGNRLFIWAAPLESRYDLRLTTQTKTFEEVELASGDTRRFLTQATIQNHRKRFFVRNSTPPPPDPDEPDPPDPDPDDPNFYGLQSRSETWALAVPIAHRQQAIDALIANFATAAKSTATPTIMLANLRSANNKVLPDPSAVRTAWLPFFENWATYVGELSQDGTLSNLTSAHQKIFAETQRGLESARNK